MNIIGIDFDNTIVCYDNLLYRLACHEGIIPLECPRNKHIIRGMIRKLPNGEISWQRLQAKAYGLHISSASPFTGALDFIRACHCKRIPVYVVSHKTRYAAHDTSRTDLRQAATEWLQQHSFLESAQTGLSLQQTFFEPSRREKIKRIADLRCSHFIDDLWETFQEETFPPEVQKFLFSPTQQNFPGFQGTVVTSWQAIYDEFF